MSVRRALVAEDSAHLLFALELLLEQLDVEIVGASSTVAGMCRMIKTTPADIAILDVNLNGELVFPAADLLIEKGVPIIFTTGYAPEKIFPQQFHGLPVIQKPYDPRNLMQLLRDAFSETKAV